MAANFLFEQGMEDEDKEALYKRRSVSAYKRALKYAVRALKECDEKMQIDFNFDFMTLYSPFNTLCHALVVVVKSQDISAFRSLLPK